MEGMKHRKVFRSLKEVFPQVDDRLLQAIAIEHSNDADAAVEYILSEILPCLSEPHESSQNDNVSDDSSLTLDSNGIIYRSREELDVQNSVSPPINDKALGYFHMGEMEAQSGKESLSDFPSNTTPSFEAKYPHILYSTSGGFHANAPYMDENLAFRSSLDVHREIFGDCLHQPPASQRDSENEDGGNGMETSLPINEQLLLDSETDGVASNFLANMMYHKLSFGETSADSTKEGFLSDKDVDTSNIKAKESSNIGGSHLESENKIVNEDGTLDPKNIGIPSVENVSDEVEKVFNDAKKNKKTLFSTMKKVEVMVEEVENYEIAALQAKNDALSAAMSVFSEVEELRQVYLQTKEANHMHAAEVYHEKSLLATEAQELQSRLLKLSNEREKSLLTVDEITEILEGRLAAAIAEKDAADKGKLEKEEEANKLLHEQITLRKEVDEESKALQLQSEENSKLKELLVDRGGMIDVLQEEMTDIFKNIMLLKERVICRAPLFKQVDQETTSAAIHLPPNSSPAILELPNLSRAIPELPNSSDLIPEIPDTSDAIPELPYTSDAIPEIPDTSDAIPEIPYTSDAIPEIPDTSDAIPEIPDTSVAISGFPNSSEVQSQTSEELIVGQHAEDSKQNEVIKSVVAVADPEDDWVMFDLNAAE